MRVGVSLRLALGLVLPVIIAGCEDGPKKDFDAGAGRGDVPSATIAATAPPPRRSVDPRKPRVKLPCRAIGVAGTITVFPSLDAAAATNKARDAGAGLAVMDTIPVGSVVDLADGAKVTVKSPLTSRETALKGPGRGMFCVDDDEKSWLFSGTFESSMGAGEAPGNEEWAFSPYGVVRYVSSNLTMQASRHRLEVKVIGGTATLFTPTFVSETGAPSVDAGAAADGGWRRADAGFSAVLATKDDKSDERRAADVADACTTQAATTHKVAQAFGSEPLAAATGNSYLLARQNARALCGMASLWVAMLPTSPKRTELEDKVAKANEDWKKLE